MKFKAITLTALLAVTGNGYGQSADAILDLLIKKGIITQREANEVRQQLDRQTAQTFEIYSKAKPSSWLDALQFSGDMRLRGEYFDHEPGLNRPDRLRFRYRLRFAVQAQYQDWATVNFRLASGDGDPVSVNQTLTDTFRKKPVTIDVASLTIVPPNQDFVKLIGGKMDNPLWQPKFASPMVYDFDVTPEGAGEQLQWKLNDRHRLFVQAGQYVVKEFNADSNDAYFFDQQVGFESKFGPDPKSPVIKLTGTGGYYLTHNLELVKAGDSPNLGNAPAGPSATTNNLADFNVLYRRAELAWKLSDRQFLGTPAVLPFSAEYDKNIQSAFENLPDDQTEGWPAQVAFGEPKKKGQWQLVYQYKHLEADAIWDAITDSDYGNGGTDRKGHIIKAAYNLQDWWQLGVTAFLTEKISRRPNTGHNTVGIAGEEQLRLQADTVLKF
jgi:hypothetical protein